VFITYKIFILKDNQANKLLKQVGTTIGGTVHSAIGSTNSDNTEQLGKKSLLNAWVSDELTLRESVKRLEANKNLKLYNSLLLCLLPIRFLYLRLFSLIGYFCLVFWIVLLVKISLKK
jgi:hypothetical protein